VSQGRVPLSQTESAKDSGHYLAGKVCYRFDDFCNILKTRLFTFDDLRGGLRLAESFMPGPREIRLSQVRNRRKKSGLPAEELDASINSGCTPRREFKGMDVRVQALSIRRIKLNARNPRTHSAKQIRQIANSIVAFGFTNPLLVTEDWELIAARAATRQHSYSAWRRCRSSCWRDFRPACSWPPL
jgi:hypothetical protein